MLQPRPLIAQGIGEVAAQRVVDHPGLHLAARGDRGHHAEQRQAAGEILGAVDRVDDEGQFGGGDRIEQRRIAVILGAASDAKRIQGAQNLLNFGFENFDSIRPYRAAQIVKNVKLYRGMRESVNIGFGQDFYLLVSKGAAPRVKAQVLTQQPIVAPVRKGQLLGRLRISLDGVILGEYPLQALYDVEVAGLFGRGWDSIKLLFAK